jgi:ELWxxDGT repeat protein
VAVGRYGGRNDHCCPIDPDATGFFLNNYLAYVSGTLFFTADDDTHGYELWRSDGTGAGTAMVADINPGSGGSKPSWLTNVSGTLFFTANDGAQLGDHTELWALPVAPAVPTPTTTAITASDNSPAFGETVTYTATISAVPPATGRPADGTVTFRFDGGAGITAHVSGSRATITKQWRTVGSGHTVDATYNGDDSAGLFHASTAPQLTLTVAQDTTTTTISQPVTNVPKAGGTDTFVNQRGTFTATVHSAKGGTPTGSVAFLDGATTLQTGVKFSSTGKGSATATFTTSRLSAGVHTISAVYTDNSGDHGFVGSTSGKLLHTVDVRRPLPPVLLLNPLAQGALSGTQEGAIAGGPVVVDSNNAAAALAADQATITAPEFDISGVPGAHTSGSGKFVGTIHSGVAPTPDPLASLPVPALPKPSFGAVNYSGTAHLTLSPGTYVGGIHVSGQAPVTLLPGIYYLKGGGFSVSGDAKVTGTGVMIYNAPLAATDTITVSHGGEADLTAPTSGTYAGVVVFQDRTFHAPITLTDHGEMELKGTFYAAAAPVIVGGTGELEAAAGSHYIASGLHVTGDGRIELGIADAASTEAVPAQALVQTAESNALASSNRPGAASTSSTPALASRATVANPPDPSGDEAKPASSTQPHLTHQRQIPTDALDLAFAHGRELWELSL